MEIKWTVIAKEDYASILEYLLSKFTLKEVENFAQLTEDTLLLISKTPLMYPQSKGQNVRKCVLEKQVSLYYQINNNQIELLRFWDNRRNPEKLEY